MRALIHALEHDRTDLETPAAPPEHLEGDVLACDDLRGLIDCLDESTILLQAADDVGIKTAIRIAVFKFRLASGTTANGMMFHATESVTHSGHRCRESTRHNKWRVRSSGRLSRH